MWISGYQKLIWWTPLWIFLWSILQLDIVMNILLKNRYSCEYLGYQAALVNITVNIFVKNIQLEQKLKWIFKRQKIFFLKYPGVQMSIIKHQLWYPNLRMDIEKNIKKWNKYSNEYSNEYSFEKQFLLKIRGIYSELWVSWIPTWISNGLDSQMQWRRQVAKQVTGISLDASHHLDQGSDKLGCAQLIY